MRPRCRCSMIFRRSVKSLLWHLLILSMILCLAGLFIKRSNTASSSDFEQKQQRLRQQLVDNMCKQQTKFHVKPSSLHNYKRIVVDQKRKLLFCIIPKVGSAFWRQLFDRENFHHFQPKYLSDFKASQQSYILQNYLKVVFLRHPLDRLWSAYNSKFAGMMPEFLKKYGLSIIRKYRENQDSISLRCAHNVTFTEFAKYVIDIEESMSSHDTHWMPYYQLCQPCDIKYDIIGKLETFLPDVAMFYRLAVRHGHLKKQELIMRPVIQDLKSAACRAPFLKHSPLQKVCLSRSTIIDSRWRSLLNTGLANGTAAHIPEHIKTSITSAETWVPFCKNVVETFKNNFTTPEMAANAMKLQKIRNRQQEYNLLPPEVKQGLQRVYEFDMALYGYSGWGN